MALNCHPGLVKLQADFYSKEKEKDDFALALEPVELLSAGAEQKPPKLTPVETVLLSPCSLE